MFRALLALVRKANAGNPPVLRPYLALPTALGLSISLMFEHMNFAAFHFTKPILIFNYTRKLALSLTEQVSADEEKALLAQRPGETKARKNGNVKIARPSQQAQVPSN